MGVFDFLKRGRMEQKASATAETLFLHGAQVQWSKRDYKAFADEAYRRNVTAYRAVKMICDALASVNWEYEVGGKRYETHAALDLLARPNPTQSKAELLRDWAGFFLLSGNAYLEKVGGGKTQELYALRSDRMGIVPGPGGLPKAFEYKVGQHKTVFDVDRYTGESAIIHSKTFHPLDDWFGLSPVEAAAYSVDQHNEAMAWIVALLQNSARPSGALTADKDAPLTDEQFRSLKAQMEDMYSGANGAGRPLLLEGGLEWTPMGLSPVDMEINEAKYSAARDICLAFGVPAQLMGIPGENKYANYQEARLAFWEETVIPLLMHLAGDLSQGLPEFGGEFIPLYEDTPALAVRRQQIWAAADASADLTIDERRAIKGYDPLPNGEGAKLANSMPSFDFGSIGGDDKGGTVEGDDEADAKALARIAGYDLKG